MENKNEKENIDIRKMYGKEATLKKEEFLTTYKVKESGMQCRRKSKSIHKNRSPANCEAVIMLYISNVLTNISFSWGWNGQIDFSKSTMETSSSTLTIITSLIFPLYVWIRFPFAAIWVFGKGKFGFSFVKKSHANFSNLGYWAKNSTSNPLLYTILTLIYQII